MLPLVYVMGPSGAGKDSVLAGIRAALGPEEKIAVAHRYITRPNLAGDEGHVALTSAEFSGRASAGLFAFRWSAHGCSYGIGIEVEAWRRAGFLVVISGSRAHFATIREDVIPVLITAETHVLKQRLASRGREDSSSIAKRLGREIGIDHPALVRIDNSGALESSVRQLLTVLRQAAPPTALERHALGGFR
jgi:ribose 1,5-bisphosphokinase